MRLNRRSIGALCCVWLFGVTACGPDEGQDTKTQSPNNTKGKADIIGDDDRRDEFSGDVSDALRKLARSTAMVMENANITKGNDAQWTLESQPLSDAYMMCPDEVFASQPVTGMCSAWLVAPDVVVTNGHCITSQADCAQKSFVFDFAIGEEGANPNQVNPSQVVACKEMLAWDNTSHCDVDFAVVRLERAVTDREPVKVRGPNDELKADNLVIIGHPFGLPRKYALNGQVIKQGDNGFTTTHDIFGGNSGSAIFDAESGTVQGLIACGGSNLQWENWAGKWSLAQKTGQPCDQTCDEDGLFFDGTEEDTSVCADGGERRRCVCDGKQLVWEKRTCLPYEAESQGQCSREQRVSSFTCETSPWLCATPYAQHTNIFAMYVDQWQTSAQTEVLNVPADASEVTSTLDVTGDGVIQTTTIYLDVEVEETGETDHFSALLDLNITLRRNDQDGLPIEAQLTTDGLAFDGTAKSIGTNPHSDTEVFAVPFIVQTFNGLPIEGSYTLSVINNGVQNYNIKGWRVANISKPTEDEVVFTKPCLDDCTSALGQWPDPLHEPFDARGQDSGVELVPGTIDTDWSVEVLDDQGEGYEVIKTRKSQTMALTRGEFAISRDFNEDIGGREITLDYRYDGEGWFQIWADDQIIFSEGSFSQNTITIPIPVNARTLKFVLGATDDSRDHELTLFDLTLSPPKETEMSSTPTSCLEGEVQYVDINNEAFCLQANCTGDEDCVNGGQCAFDEQVGVNICVLSCEEDGTCSDMSECIPAADTLSICGIR